MSYNLKIFYAYRYERKYIYNYRCSKLVKSLNIIPTTVVNVFTPFFPLVVLETTKIDWIKKLRKVSDNRITIYNFISLQIAALGIKQKKKEIW